MKRLRKLFASVALISAVACTEDQTPEAGADEELIKGKITLNADKTIICADGTDTVTFTVTVAGENGQMTDVTEDAEIYFASSDQLLEGKGFTASKAGEYAFYAVYGLSISDNMTVSALETVPEVPQDPKNDNLEFRHRMLLIQHTGATCPNCPLMMVSLKKLSESQDYADTYNLVASHSYNEGYNDDAYSTAARTLSATFNSGSYPELTFNLTNVSVGHGYDDICGQVAQHKKDSAPVGIAAAVESSADEVVAKAEFKFGAAGIYRVGAWLLEDDIFSTQSGASENWQHFHNNALRAMSGEKQTELIYGTLTGTMKEGDRLEKFFRFPLEAKWKAENCKVLVFVTVEDDKQNFDIVNCTVCKTGEVKAYDYK